MPQTKQLTEAERSLVCLASALTASQIRHGACENPRTRDLAYCSCYWKLVFKAHFSEAPRGNDDPRWDQLFALGFPVLRALQAHDGSHLR